MESKAWETLGGEAGVRPIVDRLIERVSSDLMIGFFFRDADLERVKRHELEWARAHLGGPAAYSGRPLPEAHAAHPIALGHFERRLKILEEVLIELQVPEGIRAEWLNHDRAQLAAVVSTECNPGSPKKSLPTARGIG
jgi:hemoglobin